MAKQGRDGGRGRRPGVVTAAKRGGPGRAFWIAIGVLVVLGVTGLGWMASRPKVQTTRLDPNLPAMKAEGYLLGSPTAPVEVIEFADFECPACGQFATLTEPDVRTRLVNTGQVRIRYIDFPLPMHKNTWDASNAAACADEQGKFWEMHDMLFANQDRWNGEATSSPKGAFKGYAQSIGLDVPKWEACYDADRYRSRIASNRAEAERRHIESTPTFIIGGKVVPGTMSYDQFMKYVNDAKPAAPAGPMPNASAPNAAAPGAAAPGATTPGAPATTSGKQP
jgi:protein-disulfide isomerase